MSSLSYPTGSSDQAQQDDIAIIGMSCIFPGAPDVQTYWRNIVSKVDAIGDPPEDWEADLVYDPGSQENDRIYCKRGGYLGDLARFDPLKYGVMPSSIDGGEPDHFLALRVAHEALADAGYFERPIDGARVEVILGRGTYINRGYTTLVQHGLIIDQTLQVLKQLHPEHTEAELQAIKRELKASQPPFNAEVAPALVPNIVSGRIANRLDFRGANYTVDAACASSLIAVERGMQDLLSRRCDLALVGGVHASTPAPILMIFCQLNALSHKGQIRPFDKDADGTLLGEGVGIIVLKRREDAERDGDRIYALLKGMGTASDGRALGLLAPRLEGETLALRRAYEATGISPRTVELIEAHGTGTPVGDVTEMQALNQVFGPRQGESPWCAVGSVKSMISHLIPASGIAGLIKTALALYHKVLPPTLNCDEPNAKFELEQTPFYINTETRPWIHGASTPRRAGVNAFGFGGINAHAILEEHTATCEDEACVDQHHWDTEVCILQGESRQGLIRQCEQLKTYLAGAPQVELKDLAYTLNTQLREPYRLAIVVSSLQEVEQKLTYALQRLADPQCTRIKEVSGIYFFEAPLSRQGKLAFLFPGEGAQYVNMLADLCIHFPEVRAWFDLIDRAFITHQRNFLPSQVIFPPPIGKGRPDHAVDEKRLWQMDCGPELVFTANQALFTLLSKLQLQPQAVLGHSTGEYSAFFASGSMPIDDEAQLIQHILDLNRIYERLAVKGEIPEGSLIAVGAADRDLVLSLIEQFDGRLHIAMDNCPHQIVLYGMGSAIDRVVAQLQSKGAICSALPFNRAYHTPMFKPFCDQLQAFFQRLRIVSPSIRMYSCATAQPYSSDADEVRRLAVEQWARPVRFRETIQAMYEEGIRLFVEVGPRGNLTAFVDDILRTRPYVAVAANVAHISGIAQLNHLVGLLAAHGVPMRLDPLYARRAPQRLLLCRGEEETRKSQEASCSIKLAMGLQPLRLKQERSVHTSDQPAVARSAPTPSASVQTAQSPDLPNQNGSRSKVMQEYLHTMEHFLHTQQEVMQAFLGDAKAMTPSTPPFAGTRAERLPSLDSAQLSKAIATDERMVTETDAEAPLALAGHPRAHMSPSADHSWTFPDTISQTLVKLVSEKTGYPIEMLDPTLNLEADLGIDSIKRVEILGAFQQQTGLLQPQDMDRVAGLKTLQQIIDLLVQQDGRDHESAGVSLLQHASSIPPLASPVHAAPVFPFLGSITRFVPGQEVVIVRQIDLEEDLFLRDHTLGGSISVIDAGLLALPVMPLTMSMEILAEAAATLLPDKLLVGMKDIRAFRWIALDQHRMTLQITARLNTAASGQEIKVQVGECPGSITSEGHVGTPMIEGTMVFGASYPASPPVGAFPLQAERPSLWTPERLYTEGMFHGPCFQGVVSVDRWGQDGVEATLKTLPTENLFRSIAMPHFLIDPLLLDAAGQLVGYWIAEHLETGFNVFPFRVEALHIYGPNLPPGELVKCRARIELMGESMIRSDIDVAGPDGRLYARVVGWEDRRFDVPSRFYHLRISPRDSALSRPWATPMVRFSRPESFTCCFLDGLSEHFLTAHGKIWQHVLAHLVLNRREREVWRNLQRPERRRNEWLLGRSAAKDAVRLLLKHRYGMELCPADIEIAQDEHGRPHAQGSWTAELACLPVISLAHANGTAVAIAGDGSACLGVGIDMEYVGRIQEGFEGVAFTGEEQNLLSEIAASREEWSLRLWCAKEAVAKALGRGLLGGPGSLVAQYIEAHTGTVQIALSGEIAEHFPVLRGTHLNAYTAREGTLIVASACYTRS